MCLKCTETIAEKAAETIAKEVAEEAAETEEVVKSVENFRVFLRGYPPKKN